jgi:hypothetical protein
MAQWQEVEQIASMMGGKRFNDTMWMLQIPGSTPMRRQKVFVSLEILPPDFQLIRIASPVAMIAHVHPGAALRRIGQLQVGSISYAPSFNDGRPVDGWINIATSLPLAILDLRESGMFMIYLSILARAADTLEQEFSGPAAPDLFLSRIPQIVDMRTSSGSLGDQLLVAATGRVLLKKSSLHVKLRIGIR